MISQIIPSEAPAFPRFARRIAARGTAFAMSVGIGMSCGSLRRALFQPLRRQGPHLDSRAISRDAPALDCGGNFLLRRIDALLDTMAPYSAAHDLFATALLGTSEILRPDSEGRILLSAATRAHLGLTGEAVFVGLGHKFQIWEPKRFTQRLEAARSQLRLLRDETSPDRGARE
jgi:DNA-binding transcriptional regulator/RsmH inhibitor MraZ